MIPAQPAAWSILSRSFHTGRAASTYLLTGSDGLGHWPLAITFAALVNCLEPVSTGEPDQPIRPCGHCRHCRQITALSFEDLHLAVPIPTHKNLDAAIELTAQVAEAKRQEPFGRLVSGAQTTLPIDMAREIARRLSRKANEGVTRVVLFYRMEKMRAASADALLKLIEEPPPSTVIILTAERPEMLLPTIQSRAQRIRLRRIPETVMTTYLTTNYDLDDKKARLIARLAEGSLGHALDLIDGEEETALSRRAVGMLLFKSLLNNPSPETIGLITEMVSPTDRGEVEELLRLWQSLIRDAHYYAATGHQDGLSNVDLAAELKQFGAPLGDVRLTSDVIGLIKNALADLRRNVHIQTALAALALKLKAALAAAR